MLRSINIKKFGCFSEFDWKTVRASNSDVLLFKDLNILYGRNYSGKTTLSRAVRCLETGALPLGFEGGLFTLQSEGATYSQDDIPQPALNVRVFNRDYIDANLSILRDPNGEISPFAVLGEQNARVEDLIAKLTKEIGPEDGASGLKLEFASKQSAYMRAAADRKRAHDELDSLLFRKATSQPSGIKYNRRYGYASYNVPKLRSDIDRVLADGSFALDEADRRRLETVCDESVLPDVPVPKRRALLLNRLVADTRALVAREIRPSQAIEELLGNALLQEWVKSGIALHKNHRDSCAFCGQSLPADIWRRLGAHFNAESEELGRELQGVALRIESELEMVSGLSCPSVGLFYPSLRDARDAAESGLLNAVAGYEAALQGLLSALRARQRDIFAPAAVDARVEPEAELRAALDAIDALVAQSNGRSSGLSKEQDAARATLRLSEVAAFVDEIDYPARLVRLAELNRDQSDRQAELANIQERIDRLTAEIDKARESLRDERRGADAVNQYLRHHFGHQSLSLKPRGDETPCTSFEVRRGDEPAANLSEGECSLIAFCYFLARLSETTSHGKPLVIWIDDPICSLDSNHIFFVYSLISEELADALFDSAGTDAIRCSQLFISTHNLEFLKYLKMLSHGKKGRSKRTALYLVERRSAGSRVRPMPDHLQKYTTEFTYLFGQVVECASMEAADGADADVQYAFGNSLRRFLEAYLYFKYPFSENGAQSDFNARIRLFFGKDTGGVALVERVVNEYSHLLGFFDRASLPMDSAEMSRLATYVLRKIRRVDPQQYQYLLDSVAMADPVPPEPGDVVAGIERARVGAETVGDEAQ